MKKILLWMALSCIIPAGFANELDSMHVAFNSDTYFMILTYRNTRDKRHPLFSSWESLNLSKVNVNLTDKKLHPYMKNLGIDPEIFPAPCGIVVAPNHMITGTFRKVPDTERLSQALLSHDALKIRRALIQKISVWVHVKGKNSDINNANNTILNAQKDENTEVVTLDPNESSNRPFLKQLGLDYRNFEESTTFKMVPPLSISTKEIYGKLKKEDLGTKKCEEGACGPGG